MSNPSSFGGEINSLTFHCTCTCGSIYTCEMAPGTYPGAIWEISPCFHALLCGSGILCWLARAGTFIATQELGKQCWQFVTAAEGLRWEEQLAQAPWLPRIVSRCFWGVCRDGKLPAAPVLLPKHRFCNVRFYFPGAKFPPFPPFWAAHPSLLLPPESLCPLWSRTGPADGHWPPDGLCATDPHP